MAADTRQRLRPLHEATVVVTGASSGIGRAAALEFARRGARVVVAARGGEALDSVVRECERFGSQALAVPTDVTDDAAVDALAHRAVEHFGGIDVWVNNAGVYLAGPFVDVPAADFHRVIDVNLLGYVRGARAALRQFTQHQRGVLINNCSMAAVVPLPYFSAYTASKFGILGLGLTLRQELRGSGIEVCTVLPSSIDTPIFQHAGNYQGHPLKAMTPTYDVHGVAKAIVRLAERPKRLVVVGAFGTLLTWLYPVMPSLIERLSPALIRRQQFRRSERTPSSGNLFAPSNGWMTPGGGWLRTIGLLTRTRPDPARRR